MFKPLREQIRKLRRKVSSVLRRLFGVISHPSSAHMTLWEAYGVGVRLLSVVPVRNLHEDSNFAKFGIKQGTLSDAVIVPLLRSLEQRTLKPISVADCLAGYIRHPDLSPYVRDLNVSHTFLPLGPEQLNCVRILLSSLAEPVASSLGTPWRVVNVRCWKTHPKAIQMGPTAWHTDGFPQVVFKVMVYLSGAGWELGTTEIQLNDCSTIHVKGPPGCWILFKNSKLLHRGIAPRQGERLILEITGVPSLRNDLRPIYAGLNALYPRFPWMRPKGITTSALEIQVCR